MTKNSSPLEDRNLSHRAFEPQLKRLGLGHRGLYQTRTTFITLALEGRESPGWVAEQCGTSEEMIFEHYKSFMPDLSGRDGAAITEKFHAKG